MKIDRRKLLREEAARKNRSEKEYIEKMKERDRAMKPNIETNFYPDGSFEDSWFCPVCKYDLGEEEVKFCPNCGQRIDWSEEEYDENIEIYWT